MAAPLSSLERNYDPYKQAEERKRAAELEAIKEDRRARKRAAEASSRRSGKRVGTTKQRLQPKTASVPSKLNRLPEMKDGFMELGKKLDGWLSRMALGDPTRFINKSEYKVFHKKGKQLRGFVAKQDIGSGEIVAKIPHRAILKEEDDDFWKRENFYTDLAPKQRLQLFVVLHAIKQDSFWTPYFNVLPRNLEYSDFLVHWTESELMMLDDDQTLMQSEMHFGDVKKSYAEVLKNHPELTKELDWDLWVWSYYAVITRAFDCSSVGFKECMVPLADMYNTAADKRMNTIWKFETETSDFVLTATKPIKKGTQIYLKYGNHDNRHYLVHYGFVLPSNPRDQLGFEFGAMGFEDTLKSRIESTKADSCKVLPQQGMLVCFVSAGAKKKDYQTMLSVLSLVATPAEIRRAIKKQAERYVHQHDGTIIQRFKASGIVGSKKRMSIQNVLLQ